MMRWIALSLALCLLLAPQHLAAKKLRLRNYVVKKGDTCWNISARFYGDPKRYDIIHKYNRLGPLPHILKPGLVLRLPLTTNIPDAKLEWLKRDVKAKSPSAVDWSKARTRMNLWQLYRVSTGNKSFAGIRFEDDAFLKMRQSTLVVIFGGVSGKDKTKRLMKRKVVLQKGIVRGGLAGFYKNAGLKIKTPSSEITLKSKLSQVEVDKKLASIISVFDGEAIVKAKNTVVKVLKDYGTIVEKNKKPQKPRPLPKAPRWVGGATRLVVVAPRGHRAAVVARWQPVGKVARYRVELANNKKFSKPIVDAVVGRGVTRLAIKQLIPGSYFARVSTIGRRRLHSRPSKLIRIDVIWLQTSRLLRETGVLRYEVAGLLHITPPPVRTNLEVSLNGAAWGRFVRPLRFGKPGEYKLAVRAPGGRTLSSTLRIKLLAVAGKFVEAPVQAQEGQTIPVELTLRDALARPALLPGLKLIAYPGGPLKLKMTRAGTYRSQLLAARHPGGGVVTLRLSWAGGDLASHQLLVTRRPGKPKAPEKPKLVIGWRNTPFLVSWGQYGPNVLLRSAQPQSSVGIGSAFTYRNNSGSGLRSMIGQIIQAELAFLDERLGLGMHFPWLNLLTKAETLGRSKVGDIHLGLRYMALKRESIALTPALGVLIPASNFLRSVRYTFIEPGLIFEWWYRDKLTLLVDLRGMIGFTDKNLVPVLLSGATSLIYRPWRLFSFGVDLKAMIGLAGPDEISKKRGLLISGGLRFHIKRFRIGLVASGGLTSGARDLLGDFTIGINFDVALGRLF